jgi:hypothetical protein
MWSMKEDFILGGGNVPKYIESSKDLGMWKLFLHVQVISKKSRA